MKKVPRGISEAEAFGAAIHTVLKKWGEQEIPKESSVREDQLEMFETEESAVSLLTEEHLLALWHDGFPLNVYGTRVEADAARMRGEELLHAFFVWWHGRTRTVVAVEKGFKVEIPDTVITGRFDRIERAEDGLHVIDFKTSQPRTQQEADADLQLSIYAMALCEDFGELPASLSFLHLTEDGIVEISTQRSAGQVQDALKQIGAFQKRINERDFHPTPSAAVCKHCPYRRICDVAAV